MPINGNTDTNANRPTGRIPQMRVARTKNITASNNQLATGISNTFINVDSTFAVVNAQLTIIGANVSGNNIRVGTIITNYSTNPVTGNTFITINPGTTANIQRGDVISIGNNIVYKSNTYQATFNTDTVLVTDTRKANLFANGTGTRINTGNSVPGSQTANANIAITSSTGWNHVQVGTGGRAGRIQVETLITLSNAQALNTLSGNTSNANVYYAGV